VIVRVLFGSLSTDRVEQHLVRALHEQGVRMQVICQPGSPAKAWCAAHGIPHLELEFRSRFDRKAVLAYRELLAAEPFDLIHCLTNRSLSAALQATRTMQDAPPVIGYRGTMGHLSRWDPASRLSYLHPRLRAIICVSAAVKGYLQGMGVPREKLDVIWKGHDPAWYTASSRSALTALGVPADAVVACFTGNIRPVKGVNYLLQAFDGIRPEEHIHLVVIGEVRDRRIARQIGRHPHVHFLGFRSDAPQLATACDLAIMPSIEREGLAKSIPESMSQGVPAIVTRVGGMPELVEDGISGYVVPPKDSAALREAIRVLARDSGLRARFGAAAKARIEGPFHFTHTVAKTYALYQRLCTAHA
jgi:glycosyltransferase involved in cell wall biosynthesis